MGFLMKSQRADLSLVLRKNRFDQNDFTIVTSSLQSVAGKIKGDKLVLKGTNYYFGIYPNPSEHKQEKFLVEHSPGREAVREEQLCRRWELVCDAFAEYLSFLRRELTTVDPWEDIEQFSDTLKSLPQIAQPNATVSEDERRAIRRALSAIQATLLAHVGQSAERQEFVEQQFKILQDAATKFGRKDYLMLLYTTIIGIATTVGIPSHLFAQILQPLTELVGNLLEFVHYPSTLAVR